MLMNTLEDAIIDLSKIIDSIPNNDMNYKLKCIRNKLNFVLKINLG